jgi:sugar phosphate isomerase/epimerase
MLISFHPSLAGVPAVEWPESLRIARDAGFESIDLDLESVLAYHAGDVRKELDAVGFHACACPLPVEMRQDESTFETGFERFRDLAEYAAEIGIRTMHRSIPASSDLSAEEFAPVLRRRWSACAAVAREYGLDLAVEPLGTLYRRRAGRHEFIWRLNEAAEFARSCGPGVGLLLDSWHWHLAGLTTEDIIDVGGQILHVHIADVPDAPDETLRDTERALPGEGVVDFAAFFRALDSVGYSGTASPEIPGKWSEGMSRLDSARRGLEATRAVLDTYSASHRARSV